MPPLEAMACGVPVVSSGEASLPEVVGDCAVIVDAYSPESIADGMYRVYTDRELSDDLKKRGMQRAADFTWEKSAQKLHDIYKAVLR